MLSSKKLTGFHSGLSSAVNNSSVVFGCMARTGLTTCAAIWRNVEWRLAFAGIWEDLGVDSDSKGLKMASLFAAKYQTKLSRTPVLKAMPSPHLVCLLVSPVAAYLSLLASRSDSSRHRMSFSLTGPLTLRIIERVVSSMNSTRTCVTPPREPVLY